MSGPMPKLAFASRPWIAAAEAILQELVAAHGREGRRFSLCERFTDAPRKISPSGLAAWWFRIEGLQVIVGAGEIDHADLEITADYAAALSTARRIYEADGPPPPDPGVTRRQQGERPPRYLIDLHNRLAERTA